MVGVISAFCIDFIEKLPAEELRFGWDSAEVSFVSC